ncbi:hypothetical protein [Streptomyces sp. NPDC126514]|uniref:hypothetical protein n=1 Tax=Streptomyces sp. NPDC126514 TaxID=3155210 RepID=UPI0033299281
MAATSTSPGAGGAATFGTSVKGSDGGVPGDVSIGGAGTVNPFLGAYGGRGGDGWFGGGGGGTGSQFDDGYSASAGGGAGSSRVPASGVIWSSIAPNGQQVAPKVIITYNQ